MSVPAGPASTQAMMRSTGLQLPAASQNRVERRAAGWLQLEAFGGAFLQCDNLAGRELHWGQTEDPIDPARPTPVGHFRGRMMRLFY